MTQNNNLSVLPFYTSIDEQSHRRPYAYGDIYPLYVEMGKLPTFQICRTLSGSVSTITLYTADGAAVTGISPSIISSKNVGAYVVFYNDASDSGFYSGEGQYYIAVTIGGTTYYSDVFTAVQDISAYLKVEWWDEEDFIMDGAAIAYDLGSSYFHNIVLLNTQLGKPEYEYEEEGENRDGIFFPEKMISEKTYKFNFLANEPLCDVMRLARMSDHIRITDRYGNVYNCDTFLMTPKWEVQGNVASVDAEFQTNMVAKRIGRSLT